jgi:hypothetical protein
MLMNTAYRVEHEKMGMLHREVLIQEYYAQKTNKTIICPSQPGNLKISERACQKRHDAALRKKMQPFKSEDIFNYFVSQSLIRCETCPIITKSNSRVSAQSFSSLERSRNIRSKKAEADKS